MKDIYQKASKVVCWLGESTDGSDGTMDFVGRFGQDAYDAGIMDIHFAEWERLQGDQKREKVLAVVDKLGHGWSAEAYHALVTRPWWSRVWVMQELALAEDAEFRCGHKTVPYLHFHSFGYLFSTYLKTSWSSLDLSKELQGDDEELFKRLMSITATVPATSALLTRRRYLQQKMGQRDASFYDVITGMNVFAARKDRLQATEARDRIFGILGLANDVVKLGIQPDYASSCTSVYTDVAKALITYGSVDLLALSQFPKNLDGLPSWVPDWTKPIRLPFNSQDVNGLESPFSASGSMTVAVDISPDRDSLAIHGSVVDEVDLIGIVWNQHPDGHPQHILLDQVLGEIDAMCEYVAKPEMSAYKGSNTLGEAPWRVPIADQETRPTGFKMGQRASEWSKEGYTALRSYVALMHRALSGPDIEEARAELRSTVKSPAMEAYTNALNTWDRRSYVTKRGFIGLGLRAMEPGDVICVLCGGRIPYLLRSVERGRYSLIGEIYVHGIMDGEFMATSPPTQTFTII